MQHGAPSWRQAVRRTGLPDHRADHFLVDVADAPPGVDHADERATPLAEDQLPVVGLDGLDQPSLGSQQSDQLAEPFVRLLGRNLLDIVLGHRAADPLEDSLEHFLAADVEDGVADGGDQQPLVSGEQQHQGGVGGPVEVAGASAAGEPLRLPLDEARRRQLVELFGHGGAGHAGGADQLGDRLRRIAHQQLHDPQAGGADGDFRHGLGSPLLRPTGRVTADLL